jgi:hypothetical protein
MEQCGTITIGVGEDGRAPAVEDLRDADQQGLRLIRITTKTPSTLVSLSAAGSRGVALNGEDSARRAIDNVATLLQPRRRSSLPLWIVTTSLVAAFLVLFYFNTKYTYIDWVFYTTFVAQLVLVAGGILYFIRRNRMTVVIPIRRRDASLAGQQRRTQVVIAVISAILGLVTGIGATVISHIITGT